ncbi:MAG: L,D-transpeptidase [Candidatus Levybacteria bacterium]|nr:L,D-transpeptidase [Candidatus Levybacteria bacterium]
MKLLAVALALSLLLLIHPVKSHAADILTTDKLITVDIGKQRLFAWEGGKILNEFKVSTGMRYTPTVKGSFKIYIKNEKQNMKGSYPPYEPYFLKDVPSVMFFKGAYAIHGTYWHNKFGYRASHGCVNLSVADAKWIYDWAPMGTRVEVF